VHRLAAGQAHGGGPQRVVGRRDQHFVAVVEQRLHRHHDQLGHAVAQVDVLDGDAFDFLLLAVLHHRLARAEQAFGVAVALGGGQVADHVLEDFVRRLEAKRRRVADVQLEDAVAFLFQAFGVLEHWAANVVADVGELVRFAELHDGILK
jgi:precorrin-6B methylase 2